MSPLVIQLVWGQTGWLKPCLENKTKQKTGEKKSIANKICLVLVFALTNTAGPISSQHTPTHLVAGLVQLCCIPWVAHKDSWHACLHTGMSPWMHTLLAGAGNCSRALAFSYLHLLSRSRLSCCWKVRRSAEPTFSWNSPDAHKGSSVKQLLSYNLCFVKKSLPLGETD